MPRNILVVGPDSDSGKGLWSEPDVRGAASTDSVRDSGDLHADFLGACVQSIVVIDVGSVVLRFVVMIEARNSGGMKPAILSAKLPQLSGGRQKKLANCCKKMPAGNTACHLQAMQTMHGYSISFTTWLPTGKLVLF